MYPTAHTSREDTPETSCSKLLSPGGWGERTTRHDVPSQCSMRGCDITGSGSKYPTAHASSEEIASTANSTLVNDGASGTGTFLQLAPSQCRASG